MIPESLKKMARVLRRAGMTAAGLDHFPIRDVRIATSGVGGRPGSGYGEWQVALERLGPESVVYSVGIGDDISFDLDLIRQIGVTVHAFDPTPESLEWLKGVELPDAFVIHGVALAADDGELALYPHANPDYVSSSVLPVAHVAPDAVRVPGRRLATLMEELGHGHVDLLKMDIEGAEYDVLKDIVASGADVRQLLVEFHHRFPEVGMDRTRDAIRALREAGYALFTISSRGEELGFIRQDRAAPHAAF